MSNKIKYINYLNKIERIDNPEFDRRNYVRLDKNEGFYVYPEEFYIECGKLIKPDFINCYPQPYKLKTKLSEYLNISENNIYVGAGSDAVIKSAFEIFVNKEDEIILPTPNYAMYYVYSELFQSKKRCVKYKNDFTVNINEILNAINRNIKVIFISNPNSPMGTLIKESELLKIIEKANKNDVKVFVDEAYYPFSDFTMINYINNYDNLIVSRTFSKAFSLASVRLGYIISNKDIINLYKKVRPMYEINAFAEQIAILALEYFDNKNFLNEYRAIKFFLFKKFDELKLKYIDTKTNFIHLYFPEKQEELINYMKYNNILLKKSGDDLLDKYIRISISNINNMKLFIIKLKEFI